MRVSFLNPFKEGSRSREDVRVLADVTCLAPGFLWLKTFTVAGFEEHIVPLMFFRGAQYEANDSMITGKLQEALEKARRKD